MGALEGKVAIVAGGGTGIGRAAALVVAVAAARAVLARRTRRGRRGVELDDLPGGPRLGKHVARIFDDAVIVENAESRLGRVRLKTRPALRRGHARARPC